MYETFKAYIETVQKLNINLRQQLEVAEAIVPILEGLLGHLGQFGLFAEGLVIPGAVIHQASYGSKLGREDSCLVYQAYLIVDKGIGVVAWDSEDHLANERSPDQAMVDEDAKVRFVPFAQCSSAIKALLLPQVKPLVSELMETITFNPPFAED